MPHQGHSRRFLVLSVAALVASGLSTGVLAEESLFMQGEVQVRLTGVESIGSINQRYGTVTVDSLPPAYLLRLPGNGTEAEWVERLQQDPALDAVECSWVDETPEGVRQMVVVVVGGTSEDYLEQNLVPRLHLPELNSIHTGAGILGAVLDTGVFASHEMLAGAIERGGWDFVDHDSDASEEALGLDEDGDGLVDEGAGHGTMVAGIVRLVAPQARILPLRVLDDEGRGRVFDLARAIHYAVDRGAQVINLSLGLVQHTFVIQDQILYANERGVAIVAAAGNLADENPPYYPAIDPQALSVAALDSCDIKAEFSNWHRSVDLSAPGQGVLAPFIDGGYAIGAGTSFSVPFITGQCACVLAALPSGSLMDLYQTVGDGVVDIYAIPENVPYLDELGAGRIDGIRTLQAIQGASGIAGRPGGSPVELEVWPNPSREGEVVNFLRGTPSSSGATLLLIHDVTGRLVASTPLKAGQDLVRLVFPRGPEPMPAGIWFARIADSPAPAARVIRLR